MEGDAPTRLEEELRERLRGARLVLEANLSEEDRRWISRIAMLQVVRASDPGAYLVSRTPATYACHLVAEATFSPDHHLWTHVIKPVADQQLDSGVHPGYRFTLALKELRLEPFERLHTQENTHRWVGRILAHAGVPKRSTQPLLSLIQDELEFGWRGAEELLGSWRSSRAQLDVLHASTRHFLLYGGETAADLISRCIEMLGEIKELDDTLSAGDLGLPQYLVDEAKSLPKRRVGTRRGTSEPRSGWIPKPALELDPYDGLGPTLTLPVLPAGGGGLWRVDAGRGMSEVAGSSIRSVEVQLHPAKFWRVEYDGFDGTSRQWSYEGLERVGALIFDPTSGAAAQDPATVRLSEVLMLKPATMSLEGVGRKGEEELRDIAEVPKPGGAWAQFEVRHLNVEGLSRIDLLDLVRDTSTTVSVLPTRARPSLEGTVVPHVQTHDGLAVYDSWPEIVLPAVPVADGPGWRVDIRTGSNSVSLAADEIKAERIALAEYLAGSDLARVEVSVKGPLGSDLVSHFLVAEGLEVDMPSSVVIPTDTVTSSRARVQPPLFVNERGMTSIELAWPDAGEKMELVVGSDQESEDLVVDLPRLSWTVTHESKPAVSHSASVDRVPVDEFDDKHADVLTIRTGVPNVCLSLMLVERGTGSSFKLVQKAPGAETRGPDGRWSFDLAPFADTILSSESTRLSFVLEVNDRRVRVVDLVASVGIQGMTAESRHQDEFSEVVVSFTEERPVNDRVVRFWSVNRPWEDSVEVSIPDGETSVTVRKEDGSLPPGPYLIEVDVEDEWFPKSSRPAGTSANCARVELGSNVEIAERLEALDPRQPTELLEALVAGRGFDLDDWRPEFPTSLGPELVAGFLSLLRRLEPGQTYPQGFYLLKRAIDQDPSPLLAGLSEFGAAGSAVKASILRLSLLLMRQVGDRSDVAECGPDLWSAAPLLASAVDIPKAADDSDVAARCDRFLGWHPGGEAVVPGGVVTMAEAGKSAEELQALRSHLDLVPAELLSAEELLGASFEWLLVQKAAEDGPIDERTDSPRQWFARHRWLWDAAREQHLARDEEDDEGIAVYLRKRVPPRGTFEYAAFPATVLASAHEFVTRGEHNIFARTALDEALAFAPRLVTHDLALCLVVREESAHAECA